MDRRRSGTNSQTYGVIMDKKPTLIHMSIPPIYKYEGWTFEWFRNKPFPPHPLNKNGELKKRVGDKFWNMFTQFSNLPESVQESLLKKS